MTWRHLYDAAKPIHNSQHYNSDQKPIRSIIIGVTERGDGPGWTYAESLRRSTQFDNIIPSAHIYVGLSRLPLACGRPRSWRTQIGLPPPGHRLRWLRPGWAPVASPERRRDVTTRYAAMRRDAGAQQRAKNEAPTRCQFQEFARSSR